MTLTGCETLRIRDEGRLKTAQETVGIAAEIASVGNGIFSPMEENLETVKKLQDELQVMLNNHETETYLNIMAQLTADEIGKKVVKVMNDRNSIFQEFSSEEDNASTAVIEALDRKAELAKVSGEKEGLIGSNLEQALTRLDKRLNWLEEGMDKFLDAANRVDKLPTEARFADRLDIFFDLKKDATEEAKMLKGFINDAQSALDSVGKDEQVTAAKKLLMVVVQQASQSEQNRLIEMRRHLGEIKRLKERILARDQVAVCKVYLAVLTNLYFGLSETNKKAMADVTNDLVNTGLYPCLRKLDGTETDSNVAHKWNGGSISHYVVASFKAAKEATPENIEEQIDFARSTAELVGGLGVLLFHEHRMFEDALDELYLEQHLHSIMLSRISAAQRGDLVHQLTQGLAIYYEGGVKSEEVAELLLLATQVGGIFFIGSQQ
jgi:hypothetical protein